MKILLFVVISMAVLYGAAYLAYLIVNDTEKDPPQEDDPRGKDNEDYWDMEKK